MSDLTLEQTDRQPIVRVAADEDLFGERREVGTNTFEYKVSKQDGSLFVVQITRQEKGGPGRHLHHGQDEWFYVVEGEFIIEIGSERLQLGPGDSVLGPREVPHAWAYVGNGRGRMLGVFTPAGKMDAFFRTTTRDYSTVPLDPELFRAHGMELVGPPLSLE